MRHRHDVMKHPARRSTLLIVLAVLCVLAWQAYQPQHHTAAVGDALPDSGHGVQAAFAAGNSGVWVQAGGRVIRTLPDDNDGSRHQRFILDVGGEHTVLVAHNLDLAGRIPLAVGETLELRGRYEWSEQGGVIHWTHHDPGGREGGGWIERNGVRYR